MLADFEHRVEPIMAILGLIWLALFVLDMVHGLDAPLAAASTIIWIIFIADFLLRLIVAPHRARYLERNWLTALSLLVPALRIARIGPIIRALRAIRGFRLVRAVGSLNRGMRALARTMHRRGISYVFVLTVLVTLAGAAGMYALEPHASNGNGFANYGDALWWTSMVMTTLGSTYWPRTAPGRILGFLLSLYAIGVFGYITATLASFFVDRVLREVRALRAEVRVLAAAPRSS